ncbi:MAG TPA: DUF1961 family protein [Candidatus Latescibacteria bacterium]|nr:DUF1961 family protein [Candidatus Latescibacterota bacterium]
MDLLTPRGQTLFHETFDKKLTQWRLEGIGSPRVVENARGERALRLDSVGSIQGAEGCNFFHVKDFPDSIVLDFDLYVHFSDGLFITFVAVRGLNGEDMFSLPPRSGVFGDYVAKDALLRSYHVSVSRYNDKGEHTGVSNWRRNPGLHLMAQGPDPCRQIKTFYHLTVVKAGPHLQLGVNGVLAHEFVDPQTLPIPLPDSGKIGFRAIGSQIVVDVSNIRVTSLD